MCIIILQKTGTCFYINSLSVIRFQYQYKTFKLLLHLKLQYFCIKLNVFVYSITFGYIILKSFLNLRTFKKA